MCDSLLKRIDGLRLSFRRAVDEHPDLFGEEIRIASWILWPLGLWLLFLAQQLAEDPTAALLLHVGGGRREQRNRVRLDVMRAGQRPQVRDELLFVARRQVRAQQDDIGHS